MAGYHQFHAVNKAVECTLKAISPSGDRRVGVVWHTQGSGKSLTMAFYAGKVVRHPKMENPTLVVITDRNDLDDQLFGTFSGCHELLRQKPVQADNRDEVKELLKVASGGVVFTTLQKFAPDVGKSYPELSGRRNIVVIADEAHRSQYGHFAKAKTTGEISYGFSKHLRDALPHASYLGFTGTPIELGDKNTKAVFGDYIDAYDISRAVEDGATVKIFYEGRLAKLELNDNERPKIDDEFEDITEGEFDAPCMNTMYVDKPMGGHNLMQAIARVNRVFHGKPGGLVVDYLGLAAELKRALAQYTKSDQQGTGIPIDQALEVLLEKYEIVQNLLHGFDYSKFFTGTASQRIGAIPAAMDFILEKENGQARFVQAVTELSQAFALVATHDDAVKIREEVAFFQCLRAQFAKLASSGGDGKPSKDDLDAAVRQIISKSVASDEVIDIFAAAGMERPAVVLTPLRSSRN